MKTYEKACYFLFAYNYIKNIYLEKKINGVAMKVLESEIEAQRALIEALEREVDEKLDL